MSATEQRQLILKAILKRLDKSKNQKNKCVGGQSDLGSDYGSETDRDGARKAKKNTNHNQIEEIINSKSKSIADVLLNEKFNNYHQNMKLDRAQLLSLRNQVGSNAGAGPARPANNVAGGANKVAGGDTIELTFDEEHEEDFKQMLQMQ